MWSMRHISAAEAVICPLVLAGPKAVALLRVMKLRHKCGTQKLENGPSGLFEI